MHRTQFWILATATPWYSLFPSECHGGDAHDRLPFLGTWLEKKRIKDKREKSRYGTADMYLTQHCKVPACTSNTSNVTSTQDSHDQPTMCFHHFKDTHPVTRSRHQALGNEKETTRASTKKKVWVSQVGLQCE